MADTVDYVAFKTCYTSRYVRSKSLQFYSCLYFKWTKIKHLICGVDNRILNCANRIKRFLKKSGDFNITMRFLMPLHINGGYCRLRCIYKDKSVCRLWNYPSHCNEGCFMSVQFNGQRSNISFVESIIDYWIVLIWPKRFFLSNDFANKTGMVSCVFATSHAPVWRWRCGGPKKKTREEPGAGQWSVSLRERVAAVRANVLGYLFSFSV